MISLPLAERKAELFKALAHPARIRALEVLTQGERTVGDLQPDIGIEASNLSHQLAVLRRAELVTARREGAAVVYALRDPLVADLLGVARRFLALSFAASSDLLDEASG